MGDLTHISEVLETVIDAATKQQRACLVCTHDRMLHGPIGTKEQEPGAKCAVCQCAGLELRQQEGIST